MSIELSNRYSKLCDTKTRNILVLKDGVIFNNRYEGDAKAGAVKVRKPGAITVGNYDKTNGATMSESSSSYITINIDKDIYVSDIIDGYVASAVTDDMVAERIDAATYGLASQLDLDGAAELVAHGTTLEDTTALTKSTVYDKIVDVRTALSKAGVPNDGRRWLIANPDVYALILKCDEFTKASALGDAVVQTGAVGQMSGFLVFESNNLGDGVEFVAGHPDYATRVNEWTVDVHVQDLNGSGKYIGSSAVQGRKVYAHKVTNPDCILVKTSNF